MTKTQEEGNVRPANMAAWYLHWDHQLYKALEAQWRRGVELIQTAGNDIADTFFEGEVELVYRNGQLQFKPVLEEIRSKYYREMKKFLSVPLNFKGVNLGDSAKASASLFPRILDTNADALGKLYATTESIFQKLGRMPATTYKEWATIPASVDMERTMMDSLKEVGDWESNFKFIKTKGKKAEAIPAVVAVDTIRVSTQKMKSSIDDFLQRYFDGRDRMRVIVTSVGVSHQI